MSIGNSIIVLLIVIYFGKELVSEQKVEQFLEVFGMEMLPYFTTIKNLNAGRSVEQKKKLA